MPLHHAYHAIVSIGLLVCKPTPFAINAGDQTKGKYFFNGKCKFYHHFPLLDLELHPHPNVLDAEEVVAVLDLRAIGKGPLLEEERYGLGPNHGPGNAQGVLIEVGKKVAKYRSFQNESYGAKCTLGKCLYCRICFVPFSHFHKLISVMSSSVVPNLKSV